jgi:DNA-binding response OmpR family regulator
MFRSNTWRKEPDTVCKILLVDDEEQIRALLKQVLLASGFEVQDATGGKQAVAIYQNEQPDLVITDIVMAEGEGLELIRYLRLKYQDAKIIAMSGGGGGSADTYLALARKLGASRTLAKPFAIEQLLEIVSLVLGDEWQHCSGKRIAPRLAVQ